MATVRVATLTADEAQSGDVVLAGGNVYQYNGGLDWSEMQTVGYYGEPWKPPGELTLLVRNGVPQVVAPPA